MDELQEEAKQVVRAIEFFGGSFFQGLAKAIQHADHVNLGKIKATWPEDWARYLDMYEKMGKQKPNAGRWVQTELILPSQEG